MEMTKREAVDYLHDNVGFSRRMSTQLAEIALLQKGNRTFEVALKDALEKSRTKGSKDKQKRKVKRFKIGKIPEGETRYGPAPTKKWAWEK